MTCRDEILTYLRENSPDGEFSINDVVRGMKSRGTKYEEATIRTHIASRLCVNAPDNHDPTYDDVERIGRGTYRLL